MAIYPTATTEIFRNGLPTGTGTVNQAGSQRGHENYILGRFDYTFRIKDSFLARYVLDKCEFDNPFPGTNYPRMERYGANQESIHHDRREAPALGEHHQHRSRELCTNGQFRHYSGGIPALQFYPHLGGQDGNIAITGLTGLGPSALAPTCCCRTNPASPMMCTSRTARIPSRWESARRACRRTRISRSPPPGSFTFASLLGFMQGTVIRYGGAFPVGTPVPFDFKGVNPDAYRAWRER